MTTLSAVNALPNWEYRPQLPQNLNRGIGIVGAGEIVRSAHLPAYRIAGFRVVGIYDTDRAKAEAVAAEFGIPHVFSTLDELAAHPEVEIADIAVPAKFQLDIVRRLAAAGCHVLCQKPLFETYAGAREIADICRKAGIKAAVNQQMRWSPGIQASRTAVKNGWIGQPYQGAIQVHVRTHFESWSWLAEIDTLEVMYHSIHYLDSIRYVLGRNPVSVYADGTRFPGQTAVKGETRTVIHLRYDDDMRGLVNDNHDMITDQDDWFATFRFDGTEGVVKGTNGSLYNYPVGREDTVALHSRLVHPQGWHEPVLEGRWFPHAFIGTMGELMRAIEEEREPDNSVADNLVTMQTVFAAYRSMAEGRIVTLAEIAQS